MNGFEEAIKAVFPCTEIQRCIVHQIRNSIKFVNYKDLWPFCKDMKEIYTSPNEEAGLASLDRFEEKIGREECLRCKELEDELALSATFFKYPPEIRRQIYTTANIMKKNSDSERVGT